MRFIACLMLSLLLAGCQQQGDAGANAADKPFVPPPVTSFGHDYPDIPRSADGSAYRPGKMPMETMLVYLEALRNGSKNLPLALYTASSKAMLAAAPATPAAQAAELQDLRRKVSSALYYLQDQPPLAVLRFPVDERRSAPYLFRAGKNGWQLDLAAMADLIAIDPDGRWHLRRTDNEFMFAFTGLQFDKDGYPHR